MTELRVTKEGAEVLTQGGSVDVTKWGVEVLYLVPYGNVRGSVQVI